MKICFVRAPSVRRDRGHRTCLRRVAAQTIRPVVVIGGLLTSTFLKLVLLPVLYDWVERRTRKASASTARADVDTEVDREHIIA